MICLRGAYIIQPIRVAYKKLINLKFCAPFKINMKWEGLSNFEKPVFDFSLLNPKKSGLRRKSKVCPLDTQIK